MAIDFNCSQCGKVLRVGDDAVGRQAKCPACTNIMTVPGPAAAAPPAGGFSGNLPPPPNFGANPFAEGTVNRPAGATKPDYENPYAAPNVGGYQPTAYGESPDRSGPPWERSGKSWTTFWETFKMVLGDCERCFRTMRRTGGFGSPLMFAIAGSYFGAAFSMVWQLLFGGAMVAMQPNAPPEAFLQMFIQPVVQFILLPVGVAISLFLGAAITHVCLMMLGGDKAGYEGTFRVLAYVQGATGVLQAIPCVGALVVLVAVIVCEIIGLAQMHEISGGKAAAAVLLPLAVCCVVVIGIIAAFFGTIAAMGH